MAFDCYTNTSSSNDSVSPRLNIAFGSVTQRIANGWCLGVLLLALLMLQLLSLDSYLEPNGDNAIYIIIARSLAQGSGYRLANTPESVPFAKFPPVFAFSLTPLVLFGGDSIQLLKLLPAVSFWLALVPLYYLVRPALGVVGARVLILLSITNPWLYRYANIVRPEGLYLLLSLSALALFACSKDRSARSLVGLCLAAVCAALAFLTRTIGVSLMVALLVVLAWRRHWLGSLATTGVYASVLAPWLLHVWNLPSGIREDNYLRDLVAYGSDSHSFAGPVTQLVHLGRLALDNLPTYIASWAGALSYAPTRLLDLVTRYIPPFALADTLVGLAVLAMLFWGIWLSLGRGIDALAVYLLGYMAICLVWPWQGEKFLVPVIPAALFFLAASTRAVNVLLARSEQQNFVLIPLLAVTLLVSNAVGDAVLYLRRAMNPYPPEWQSYFALADWTSIHLSHDVVVTARKPYLFHLRSRHLTVRYPSVEDDTRVLAYLRRYRENYVVVGAVRPEDEDIMAAFVSRHSETFTLVYATGPPTTQLYRVLP